MTGSAHDTHDQIMDATLAVAARVGLAKLALEDVADQAGVSRQTVYRHFGSRDGLLTETIVREEEAILALVDDATEEHDDVETAVRTGLAAAFHGAADHPLLQRLLTTEPEALLPFLLLGSGPVLSVIGPKVAQLVGERAAHLDPEELEFMGDALGRAVVSYVIAPRDDLDDTAARLARFVAGYVTAREDSA
jgi:AcrR family transcriptional regulator